MPDPVVLRAQYAMQILARAMRGTQGIDESVFCDGSCYHVTWLEFHRRVSVIIPMQAIDVR